MTSKKIRVQCDDCSHKRVCNKSEIFRDLCMSVHSVIERSGRTDDVRAEVKCLDYLGGAFQKLNTAYRAVSEKGENNEKERITLGFKP